MRAFRTAAAVAVGIVAAAGTAVAPASAAVPGSPAAAVCTRPPKTANRHATAEAVAVHKYLWGLTCGTRDGVISGQNIGHGSQAADPDGWFGYARLIQGLAEDTGKYVGVAGVDYEHDQVFTPDQLRVANRYLIGHERRGGLVQVTWSPSSPWLNDETDLVNHPGVWTDTRTDNGQLEGVVLTDLLDPTTVAGEIWQRKLKRVADALTELRDAGVVVLWRPMQEMNGWWFWWGITLHPDDPTIYVDLWRQMYRYFTVDRKLNNLLWVYSPSARPDPRIRESAWAYPGSEYVDVVAGTSYHDELLIPEYGEYLAIPEVIAEGEYSAGLLGAHDRDGDLDTTLYAQRLRQDYPAVAYWVSWHDFPWSATEDANLALASNLNPTALLNSRYVLTADELRCR